MNMIRCPVCNAMLDEMNFPKVRCPNCEAVIETKRSRVQTDLPPPPSYQRVSRDAEEGRIPEARIERKPELWERPSPPGAHDGYHPPPVPYYPPGYGPDPSYPSGYGPPPYYPPGYGPAPYYPPGYMYPPPMRPRLNVSDMIADSFNLYRDHLQTFIRFWALPGVLSIVLLVMIEYITRNIESMEWGDVKMFILVLIPLYVLLLVVQILFSGGVIAMTLETVRKGRPTVDTGFGIIKERGGKIVLTSLAVSFITGIGFVLCIIPGFLFCYWYFFAVTIVTLEGFATGDALTRSKEFSTGQRALGFIIILLLVVGMMNMIGSMFSVMLSFMSEDLRYAGSVISGIVSWIVAPYIYIATAYYYIRGSGLDAVPGSEDLSSPPENPPPHDFIPQPGQPPLHQDED